MKTSIGVLHPATLLVHPALLENANFAPLFFFFKLAALWVFFYVSSFVSFIVVRFLSFVVVFASVVRGSGSVKVKVFVLLLTKVVPSLVLQIWPL